jgi:hypothetical protein
MPRPEISIVIGTWNRLEALKGCIFLCRKSVQGIPYEIIVVDGGSSDGTKQWLSDQADVLTVQQGRLVGACRAFTAGFRLARSAFVVHLNDDDEPQGDCIARAYRYMKDHPDVGQVAFAFDLYDPGHYKHETVFGRPYANKGMTRREVGDRVRWWPDGNRWENGFYTYAGDCEMSCRVWESGYKVVALPKCRVHDLATKDKLREINNPTGRNPDSVKFYGQRSGIDTSPGTPRRVLHVALNTPTDKQPAMERALRALGEYRQLDWQELGADFGRELVETVHSWDPTLVFMQLQTAGKLKADIAQDIVAPHRKVVNWSGDVRSKVDAWYHQIGRIIDLTLFTNTTWVDRMARTRVNADYLQIGFNQEIYHPWGEVKPSADIVFMGRHYGKHFPFSVERMDMVKHLKERYGDRFKVYGTGWPWETQNLGHYAEAAHYRGAKIAVGISQFALGRYTSDRLHRAMGSGPLYLTRTYPGMGMEFTPGSELDDWKGFDGLDWKIDAYLEDEQRRRLIANRGSELLHERHTWLDRMYQLAEMIGWHPWK